MQVNTADAVRMVEQLKSRMMEGGGGWERLEQVWAGIDVAGGGLVGGAEELRSRGVRSAVSVSISGMRLALRNEIGLVRDTRSHPLTPFELARLFVGLFHFGWKRGVKDFWVLVAYSRELGFRERRGSKDLGGVISSSEGRNR